ncbi:MAG: tyrosine-type recombinase/integrase [Clostridia bacterium]|nr:tyrosine-type recombinase/integrase [Clostridia bacterium]MBR0364930.1 tyrosine-type recombinase/integrase [Clostridia bacterium]
MAVVAIEECPSNADITLHSLRHANATLMLAAGVDLKVVSALLGHSSITVTANIYTDVLDRSKLAAAQVVAEQLTE